MNKYVYRAYLLIMLEKMERDLNTLLDIILIAFCIYAAAHWEWFAGGWGWFLLLGLSPRAWRG